MQDEGYRLGDFRTICDRSGFKCWASETVIESWSGARVLRRFADVRNPQDYPVNVPNSGGVPNARPESADTFVSPVSTQPGDL